MKPTLAATMFAFAGLAITAFAETVNFDSAEAGKQPFGWTATKTGKGEPKWTVVADETAPSKPNVLKQSGEATYPVCIKDGFVEVKFKPVSSKEDQAGGIRESQRPKQRSVDQGENGSAGPHSQGKSEHGRGGEAGVLAQHPLRRNECPGSGSQSN